MQGRRLLVGVIATSVRATIVASMVILILLIVWGLVIPHPSSLPDDNRFLIIGLTQDRSRDDTIMVVQWDEPHARARILGVPRDTAITLPGIGTTKLAHAYATGGIDRARDAVVALLDIPIAHYVVFSLPAMRHIVDLLGGVPIIVEKRMVYKDSEQGLVIDLQPGFQVLDGVHAEQYLRFRNDPDGDLGRIRRQQGFIRATLAAARRPSVWIRLPWIIGTARAELKTDLTIVQILGWMSRAGSLSPEGMSAHSIAGEPVVLWDDLAGMNLDFWLADTRDLHAKVQWLVTGAPPPPPVPGASLTLFPAIGRAFPASGIMARSVPSKQAPHVPRARPVLSVR